MDKKNIITIQTYMSAFDTIREAEAKIDQGNSYLEFYINGRLYFVEKSEDFYEEIRFASMFDGDLRLTLEEVKDQLSKVSFDLEDRPFYFNGLRICIKGVR